MSGQATVGKAVMDVRRLAALDMHGRHGSVRRRRLILAEFVLAPIDVPLLGLAILRASSSAPQVLLGAYLIGVGLNFVPLAVHAISLARAGRIDAELAGVDVPAMALGQALQHGADPRLRLAALAPVSGTYDVAHAELPAIFTGQIAPKSATFYLPYILLAWNRIYHLFQRPAQAFRAPYDHTMPVLYDGYHTDAQIEHGLAPTLGALLTPGFLRLLHHPAGGLLRGLRINDATCGWHPNVPVRLYAARADRDSVIANARHCQAALAAHGAVVPVIDVGPVDHDHSLVRALPQLLTWFQHLS